MNTCQVEGDAGGVSDEVAVREVLWAGAAGLPAHLAHDVVQYGVGVQAQVGRRVHPHDVLLEQPLDEAVEQVPAALAAHRDGPQQRDLGGPFPDLASAPRGHSDGDDPGWQCNRNFLD